MLFHRLMLVLAALVVMISGCENPVADQAKEDLNRTVTFRVDPTNLTFGNATIGYAAPVQIWFAGTTNNWTVNDPSYELALDGSGDFVLKVPSTKGTVIKFKYIIKTSKSLPKSSEHNLEGDWWTNMGQSYATYPEFFPSPAPSGVTAEADGYGGYNAVYTVK